MSKTTTYTAIKSNLLASQRNKNKFVFDLAKSQYDSCLAELTDEQQQELGILINQTRVIIENTEPVHIPVVELNQEDSEQLDSAITDFKEAEKQGKVFRGDLKETLTYLNDNKDCLLDDPECESCQA